LMQNCCSKTNSKVRSGNVLSSWCGSFTFLVPVILAIHCRRCFCPFFRRNTQVRRFWYRGWYFWAA
jgi:hypothetical protein